MSELIQRCEAAGERRILAWASDIPEAVRETLDLPSRGQIDIVANRLLAALTGTKVFRDEGEELPEE